MKLKFSLLISVLLFSGLANAARIEFKNLHVPKDSRVEYGYLHVITHGWENYFCHGGLVKFRNQLTPDGVWHSNIQFNQSPDGRCKLFLVDGLSRMDTKDTSIYINIVFDEKAPVDITHTKLDLTCVRGTHYGYLCPPVVMHPDGNYEVEELNINIPAQPQVSRL